MCVAQEHPQDARPVSDRALGQPRTGALDDEGTEDGGRELRERLDPDPTEVGLEAVEVVPIAADRGGAKATLLDEVLEEPWERPRRRAGGWWRRPLGSKRGEHDREHLLDRTAHLLGHRSPRAGALVVGSDAIGHERLDVGWQIAHGVRAPRPRELAESEHDRAPGARCSSCYSRAPPARRRRPPSPSAIHDPRKRSIVDGLMK